jgi:lipoprotein-anchoring transpeptidase ErfK/SrfK
MRLTRFAALVVLIAGLLLSALPAQAAIEVRVNKASQRMTVIVDGVDAHSWPVSTGLGGGPRSGTYRPQRLERKWNSRKYHWAPMPYAVFFDEGYAIHGTVHVKNLGRRASKGCVRLHPANAAILFALVQKHGMKNTRIIVQSGAAASADR